MKVYKVGLDKLVPSLTSGSANEIAQLWALIDSISTKLRIIRCEKQRWMEEGSESGGPRKRHLRSLNKNSVHLIEYESLFLPSFLSSVLHSLNYSKDSSQTNSSR